MSDRVGIPRVAASGHAAMWAVLAFTLVGRTLSDRAVVMLADDGALHTVGVTLGRASTEQVA